MPGRKATGTNTAASTSVVAITGPVICPMPRRVASTAPRSGFSSMFRCAFSTTTMASSTTSVIASTIANSVMVLAE